MPATLDATNNTITYSLTSNADGRFTIDTNTGVVTVAGDIDLRSTVMPLAHHGQGASIQRRFNKHPEPFTITINDVDEFDVGAVADSDVTANAVDENAANGTVVGVTALASDADATNNTITYSA